MRMTPVLEQELELLEFIDIATVDSERLHGCLTECLKLHTLVLQSGDYNWDNSVAPNDRSLSFRPGCFPDLRRLTLDCCIADCTVKE